MSVVKKLLIIVPVLCMCFCMPFSSCTHTVDVLCDTISLGVQLVGGRIADEDTCKVVRYTNDGLFDNPIDSSFNIIYSVNDTTALSLPVGIRNGTSNSPSRYIVPGYDYKLSVPHSGITYLFTDIKSNGKHDQEFTYSGMGGGPAYMCFNNVVACKVNDTAYTVATNTSEYATWIMLYR
jgi:hypothetical protein